MPVYDCGAADCAECQRAFGPDRSKAIANYEARAAAYAKLDAENRALNLRKAQGGPPQGDSSP